MLTNLIALFGREVGEEEGERKGERYWEGEGSIQPVPSSSATELRCQTYA
jgi:hypothetical protein